MAIIVFLWFKKGCHGSVLYKQSGALLYTLIHAHYITIVLRGDSAH